jgi:capsular polysaccharide biosynthesis protein
LRLLLAVGVGAGLAFLAHYLDPTVRERPDVEAAGVPVLASIPKRRTGLPR